VFEAGPSRKSLSERLLSHAIKRRRPGDQLEVFLALVFMLGVGCSLLGFGEEAIAAPMGPSAPASEWSRFFYPDTTSPSAREDEASGGQKKKEQMREPLGSATSCDDMRVLVDRSHSLPSDYAPGDLVPLQDYGVPTLRSGVLRREAAEHLGLLVEGAAAAGEELMVASAYRSYEDQQLSHERLVNVFGASAGRMSATPGHSQHQLGTAVDLTNAAAGYQVWVPFAQTSAYWWLEHHAWEYGFVLAYPRGKEEQTGYQWEPWHYRYVGVEDAKRLDKGDLSLQEFLEREGATPHC
jgi:zinc D-Ala-D-Ala carboxypeptidase